MKKLLSLILCVLMIATALPVGIVYASEEELSDTELLIACIDVLGKAEFTDSFHTKLIAAERMYDELSAAEQKEITNYSLLHDARIEYNYIAGDRIDTSAYTPYAKGTFGTINWCLFTNGLLEITGSGTLSSGFLNSNLSKVNAVLVRDNISSIGNNVFDGMDNIEVLTIPSVSDHIGYYFGGIIETKKACEVTCQSYYINGGYYHNRSFTHAIYTANGGVYIPIKTWEERSYDNCDTKCEEVFINEYDWGYPERCFSGENTKYPYRVGTSNNRPWISYGGFYTYEEWNSTLHNIVTKTNGDGLVTHYFEVPTSLKYVNVSRYMADYAFTGCAYLERVKVGDLGTYAFAGCSALKDVVLSENVKRVSMGAFIGCESLTSLILPEGVKSIGEKALYVTNLRDVILPMTINSIEKLAFSEYGSLNIWYPGSIANRADINIDSDNNGLYSATWHYDTCVDDHTYTASCDEVCDNCEWIRKVESPHNYDNNCDARCNICNSKRTPADHVYDHACDSSCNECGFERVANPHKEITDKAVAPTCLKSGLTAGTHCSVCGVVVTAQQVVPATGHNVDKNWTLLESSTCSKTGLYVKYCSNCFKIVETEDAPLAPHIPVTDKGVAATCTTTGLTDGSHCSVCKAVIVKQEVIPFANHIPNAWIITKSPTCTEEGTKVRYCVNCSKILQTDVVEVLPHTVAKIGEKQATCYSTGLTEGSYCSVCDTVLVPQEVIPIAEHTPTDTWIVTEESTCSAHGTKVKTCIFCNIIMQTADADLKAHTIVTDYGKAATCIYTGLTNGSHCSACNTVLVAQEVIPAKGHTPSAIWTITDTPTCTEKGTKVRYCTVCDKALEKVVMDNTSHTVVTDKAVNATCTDTGLTEGSHCSVCNAILVAQEVIPAKGHNPSIVWTFPEMPTCTKEGTKVRVCIDCDQIIESVKVDTIPHIEETVPAVKATCLTTGLTEGTRCSVCDTVIIAQETVGLAPHDYCYKEVHIEGTDKKYTLGNCSVCGVSILRNCDGIESLTVPEEVTAMADYAIIDGEDLCEVIIGRNVTSMGTNSVGYTATTDEATNEISYIKTDNFVIKGYKNTVAEKYAETNGFEFVPIEDDLGLLGDVNLDGVLNIRDATAIQKHLASLVALDESALTVADFNQDSKINIKDATAIQKRLAGFL